MRRSADATSYVIALEMPVRHEPPRPTDPRVKIDTVPVRRVATLPMGETSFATYDDPGVVPFLGRNEAWVEG